MKVGRGDTLTSVIIITIWDISIWGWSGGFSRLRVDAGCISLAPPCWAWGGTVPPLAGGGGWWWFVCSPSRPTVTSLLEEIVLVCFWLKGKNGWLMHSLGDEQEENGGDLKERRTEDGVYVHHVWFNYREWITLAGWGTESGYPGWLRYRELFTLAGWTQRAVYLGWLRYKLPRVVYLGWLRHRLGLPW